MHISLIAAMSENGVIGANNALPWHLPEELKYFKKVTAGKPVVMGHKTFESMGSRPLPGRQNIILTRDKNFSADNCTMVHSIDQAVHAAGHCEELMIIGGSKVYEQFLPLASRMYLTIVHQKYAGDTYFPSIDWQQWELMEETPGELFTTKVFNRRAL